MKLILILGLVICILHSSPAVIFKSPVVGNPLTLENGNQICGTEDAIPLIQHGQIELFRENQKIVLRMPNARAIEVFINSANRSISLQERDITREINNALQLPVSKKAPVKISNADALFGIYEIHDIYYLALVSKSAIVMHIYGHPIKEVKEITLVRIPSGPSAKVSAGTQTHIEQLITTTLTRHGFLYCTSGYDLTRSFQYNAMSSEDFHLHATDWKEADQRFFWNYNLVNVFSGFDEWICPMVNAWVSRNEIRFKNQNLNLTLITRRSRLRQGPRYNSLANINVICSYCCILLFNLTS